LQKATQCLLVLSEGWKAKGGELYRLHRRTRTDPWQVEGSPLDVSLGRGGMAPGLGFLTLPAPAGLRKVEGDDRAPAGVFPLGRAFGFPAAAPEPSRYSYLQLTRSLEAVDDPRSRFYNQIVDVSRTSARDWEGSEKMRGIPTYRLGIIVEYNTLHPQPGAGSCIFVHCWKSPHEPTSGCTAMAEKDLQTVIGWLDDAAHPVLVQLPRPVFATLRDQWSLPEVP
jgi:D-alanyl-D-alanine dipeptidase